NKHPPTGLRNEGNRRGRDRGRLSCHAVHKITAPHKAGHSCLTKRRSSASRPGRSRSSRGIAQRDAWPAKGSPADRGRSVAPRGFGTDLLDSSAIGCAVPTLCGVRVAQAEEWQMTVVASEPNSSWAGNTDGLVQRLCAEQGSVKFAEAGAVGFGGEHLRAFKPLSAELGTQIRIKIQSAKCCRPPIHVRLGHQ